MLFCSAVGTAVLRSPPPSCDPHDRFRETSGLDLFKPSHQASSSFVLNVLALPHQHCCTIPLFRSLNVCAAVGSLLLGK